LLTVLTDPSDIFLLYYLFDWMSVLVKELPKPGVIPAQKSDKEKSALKKKIKDKVRPWDAFNF
jgi:hypothetical protein